MDCPQKLRSGTVNRRQRGSRPRLPGWPHRWLHQVSSRQSRYQPRPGPGRRLRSRRMRPGRRPRSRRMRPCRPCLPQRLPLDHLRSRPSRWITGSPLRVSRRRLLPRARRPSLRSLLPESHHPRGLLHRAQDRLHLHRAIKPTRARLNQSQLRRGLSLLPSG